jgi:hypothetical protein
MELIMLIPAREAIGIALRQARERGFSTMVLGLGNLDLSKSDDDLYGDIQHWNHGNPSSYAYTAIQSMLRKIPPVSNACMDCGGTMEGSPLHCEYAEWDITLEEDAAPQYCGFPA